MLHAVEDRNAQQLMFKCRTCQYSEPAATACVYRNQLYNTVGETAGVTQDVGSDPTVGHHDSDYYFCGMCGDEIICTECGVEGCPGLLLHTEGSASSSEADSMEDITDDIDIFDMGEMNCEIDCEDLMDDEDDGVEMQT